MHDRKALIYPIIFALVLAPVFIVAMLTFSPGSDGDCAAPPAPVVTHTHYIGLASTVIGDLQLIFNVSPAAPLYQVIDGALELCGDTSDPQLKHITLDVNDARFVLGERLPVTATLTLRDAATGQTVLEASAPAMYAPGHGYHFGDNYRVPSGATYAWEVTVSPVQALRLEGTQSAWLEPVTWSGEFTITPDGTVQGARPTPPILGEFTQSGVHVVLSHDRAQPRYRVTGETSTREDPAPGTRYLIVDVTDHAVNYEAKLPGAQVSVTLRQGAQTLSVPLEAAVAPDYGFHYGANVALGPGDWTVEITVDGLEFLRHAGAAVGLPRGAITGTLRFTLES